MNYKNILTGIATGLFLSVQICMVGLPAQAGEPKKPAKDVAYILGFYYGNGENILIREAEGHLELLYKYSETDKSFAMANRYPLTKMHFDAYTINEAGPMGGSEAEVHFDRDPDGYGISCRVGGHTYTRAFLGYTQGEKPKVFSIPGHKAEEWDKMLSMANSAAVPAKLQKGKRVELINATAVPGLKIKSIYGGAENLFGHALYPNTNLYLARETAAALVKVQTNLEKQGYGLVLYDAYRPWYISKLATAALPPKQKDMLENPDKQGSKHNTGIAVDVSLIALATGEEVEMPCAFDEPSFRQYSSYAGGTTLQRYRRDLLKNAMLEAGFKSSEMEWWHFELGKVEEYAHLNISYAELK